MPGSPERLPLVEVCCEGLAAALAAGAGGADRVELCENLAVGGVTPGAGAIAVACERLAIPVHVLVRPHGGEFTATDAEFAAMLRDIATSRDLGAAGIVVGLLDPSGEIDRDRTARLVEAARPLSVTFHKAFDGLADPLAGHDVLAELGVDRVLTSGPAPTALRGVATLGALVRRSAGRVAILAGGRVTARDFAPLAAAGVREVHTGSAVMAGGRTDPGLVARFVADARRSFADADRPRPGGPLWHLVPRADWDRAVAAGGPYRAASLESEGFIHLSGLGQVAGSADRFFAGCPDLVALRVDPTRVVDPLVWEPAIDRDEDFPHLFGPIPMAAVVEVAAMYRGADGRFMPPAGNGPR